MSTICCRAPAAHPPCAARLPTAHMTGTTRAALVGVVAGAVLAVGAGVAALLAYSWGPLRQPGRSELDVHLEQARATVRASAQATVEQALAGELGEKYRVAATAALDEAGVALAEAPSRVYSLMLTILIDRDEDVQAALVRKITNPGGGDPLDDPATQTCRSCRRSFPTSALNQERRCPGCAGHSHHQRTTGHTDGRD